MPQVEQTGRSAVLKEKSFTRSSKSSSAHGKAVVARPSVTGGAGRERERKRRRTKRSPTEMVPARESHEGDLSREVPEGRTRESK